VPVRFVFMTGHVNGQGEDGVTNRINNYIRNHCITNNRILYDFADIESYDPDDNYFLDKNVTDGCVYDKEANGDGNWATEWIVGKTKMESTTDTQHDEPHGGDWYDCSAAHTHPVNANMKAYGAWYLFARLAGWEGPDSKVYVDSISLWTTDSKTWIDTIGGHLQVYAEVYPDTADDKTILWEISPQTGEAVIDQDGLVTAVSNGTIRVIGHATDGSGISDTLEITITNQEKLVTGISLSIGDGTTVLESGQSVQVTVTVEPADADNPSVLLEVINLSGTAAIDPGGLLTAADTGWVNVKATAQDGSGIADSILIHIIQHVILVDSIGIYSDEGIYTIDQPGGMLYLKAKCYPLNATDTSVTWSVNNVSGEATIDQDGGVTAVSNGMIKVIALAVDGSGISDTLEITITNQEKLVTGISLSIGEGITEIESGQRIEITVTVEPADADNPEVSLEVINLSGTATICSCNFLTASDTGWVKIKATALDGSGISDSVMIHIYQDVILVDSIGIYSDEGVYTIDQPGGMLHLNAKCYPLNATDTSVTWSVSNKTGEAMITAEGLLTAVSDGEIFAIATAGDGAGTQDSVKITITGQSSGLISQPASLPVLYPNPSDGIVMVRDNNSIISRIEVLNFEGKSILLEIYSGQESIKRVDISQYPAGLYYFRIRTMGKENVLKIIKQ